MNANQTAKFEQVFAQLKRQYHVATQAERMAFRAKYANPNRFESDVVLFKRVAIMQVRAEG